MEVKVDEVRMRSWRSVPDRNTPYAQQYSCLQELQGKTECSHCFLLKDVE